MADSINGSDYGILNWDSPTRVPPNAEPSSPDVLLASASLITSCSWQTLSTLSSDHLPILIRLQMKTPSNPGLCRTYVNLKKANWDRYRQEVEAALSCCCLPTPMALASGGSPMFPPVVHQPASPSIWPAVQSLRRGLSTNPGATMWCVCGCS